MIKKAIFWSLMVGGVLVAVNSIRPGSINTAWKRVHAKIERKISPEFELARIRDQIAQLTPDMNQNISRIAEEVVKVKSLEAKADDLHAKLDGAKDTLALMTKAIDDGQTRVVINNREIPITKVRDQLRNCQLLERELNNTKKIYEAKRSGLDSARQQLAEMKRQKDELEVMAANYEAELKTLALEQTRSKIQLDDSRLAEIKQSFEQLRERIDIERQKQVLAEEFKNDTLGERKPAAAKDVLDEAREYLGNGSSKIDATKK